MAERDRADGVGRRVHESIGRVRAEVEASFLAARERAARRLDARPGEPVQGDARAWARTALRASREHARELLGKGGGAGIAPGPGAVPDLTIEDLHTLERLLSHVRHSVVRVCFYNLKLFCPSLVDEYDGHVRDQVTANIGHLGAVRAELDRFFGEGLSGGRTVAGLFPECALRARGELEALEALAAADGSRLDEEAPRGAFAGAAPGRIDAVMDALQDMQRGLDARKISVGDAAERAVAMSRPMADAAGIGLGCTAGGVPKIFGDEAALINCFSELIANAARYSGGTELSVAVDLADGGGRHVRVVFEDNGRGMTPEELDTCLARGVSRDGTGEGLPMVVGVVEAGHLGAFSIETGKDGGCRATVLLPVKWSPGM